MVDKFGIYHGRGRRLRRVGRIYIVPCTCYCLTHRGRNNTKQHRSAMPTIGAYGIKMVKIVVKAQLFFLSQLCTKK